MNNSTLPPLARSILDFWFGDAPLSPQTPSAQSFLWWQGSKDIDFDIERRFGKLLSIAGTGVFDDWIKVPKSGVALIILMDQFPRNIYRGSAEAFSYDRRALAKTFTLLESGAVADMHPLHACFALMPLEHSENLEDQNISVIEFERLVDQHSQEWRATLEGNLEFARQHRDIIERFGRFPHRNEALGRKSTSEELEYLGSGATRFGQ
jgi:uncharacterized protein (DUF924 family)